MAIVESTAATFMEQLEQRGVTRRTFLKFCGAIAAMLGLEQAAAPKVAQALEEGAKGKLAPVVWLELASCSGCTESLAQVGSPDVATVVLELISLNYSETLCAAAGWSLEQARKDTIAAGGYLCVVEGAVTRGWDGNGLRIANEKGTDILAETAEHAVAVIAAGSCAVDGGWVAGYPNPSNACGVQEFLNERGIKTPVINMPACPCNPEWIVAVLVDFLLMGGAIPELDSKGMPKLLFGEAIHDNCPRRGHFENGEFVYQFGSVEEQKGYCLYAVGCKGPQTYTHCPITRWNEATSWCVEAGAPCIGCGSADPGRTDHNWVDLMTPFLKRHVDLRIGDNHFQAIPIATGALGLIVAAIAVHAVGMKVNGRLGTGAPYEPIKEYDAKKMREEGLEPPTEPITKAKALEMEQERRAAALKKIKDFEEGGNI